ncbi:MAG: hypothetical protein ABWJ97_04950 [Thermoproteus sp.]
MEHVPLGVKAPKDTVCRARNMASAPPLSGRRLKDGRPPEDNRAYSPAPASTPQCSTSTPTSLQKTRL